MTEPIFLIREMINASSFRFPKGFVAHWPSTLPLPDGFIWLRQESFVEGYAELTKEAQQVIDEAARLAKP